MSERVDGREQRLAPEEIAQIRARMRGNWPTSTDGLRLLAELEKVTAERDAAVAAADARAAELEATKKTAKALGVAWLGANAKLRKMEAERDVWRERAFKVFNAAMSEPGTDIGTEFVAQIDAAMSEAAVDGAGQPGEDADLSATQQWTTRTYTLADKADDSVPHLPAVDGAGQEQPR